MPPIITAVECNEEMQCALCLDSWKDPVEVVPCGHIFCKSCVENMKACPMRCGSVNSLKKPNRALINMSLAIRVKCETCGWGGTREQSASHVCSSGATAPVSGARPQKGVYSIIEPSGPAPWRLYGLSQEEYDQIMTLFVSFDDDDSGELSRTEVTRLARWLNFAHSEEDINRIFRDMDTSGDGSLSLNEFMTWLCHNRPDPKVLYGLSQADYHTIMMQFHIFDTNQNGYLDQDEFVRFVLHMGEVKDRESGARLFNSINSSRSGRIYMNEFLTYRLREKQFADPDRGRRP